MFIVLLDGHVRVLPIMRVGYVVSFWLNAVACSVAVFSATYPLAVINAAMCVFLAVDSIADARRRD